MRSFSAQLWAFAAVLFADASLLEAQGTCAGAPFVNVLRPRAMEESAGAIVGPQIFATALHPRGFVLMANNSGLLTYDGVDFRLTPLGRSAVALSVAVGSDGRMFAGGSRTFGEVVEDPTGLLLYQPLESQLDPKERDFSDVWQTMVAKGGAAYFRAPERIAILLGGRVQTVTPVGRFTAASLVDEVLYAHDSGIGLVTVKPDRASPLPGGEFFKGIRVTAIAAGPTDTLLIGTQDSGLFTFDPRAGRASPQSAFTRNLATSEILSVQGLEDGSIAVGTLRSGLFVIDGEGRPLFQMDVDRGLPDNAILSLAAEKGSLWAGTSGGVAQLLVPSAVQVFGTREGLPGIVESIANHDGSIYAATSQGVFRRNCGARAFEPVTALRKQSFALLSAGSLLAATADGVYEIGKRGVRLVRPGLTRAFAKSKDPNRIWLGTQSGPGALRKTGDTWSADRPLTLNPPSAAWAGVEATSVGEDEAGRLWASLVTGVVIAGEPRAQGDALELTAVRGFGAEEGLSKGFAEVISLAGGIRIGTADSVLEPVGAALSTDVVLAAALGRGRGAFRIEDARDGGLWIASAKRPLRLANEGKGGLAVRNTALLRATASSRILDFLELSDSEVWVATDDGALRYDPSRDSSTSQAIAAHVRRVRSNETELFSGGPGTALEAALPHLAPLRFEVSSSSLDDPSRNRFRFRLDGQDTEWSAWSGETRKDYTNLGPGTYKFRVETRDVYGRVGTEAGLSFVVLPPWYRKPWAVALGMVAVAGLFALALRLRTRSLLKRQHELEIIVDQKTMQLKEASFTDPLTTLRNRRYFAEVMEGEASLACRPGSSALHLFLVDLDYFKQVNDTHGHAAGDDVLRQTAARLKTAMRTSDLIFRWGGEEFLIVARGAPDLPRNEIANRIVRTIGQEPFTLGGEKPLAKTCSVGFATFPFYAESPTTVPFDAVLELTDLALYRAKETGRNRAVGVSPTSGVPSPGDVWKDKVLESLEKVAVSVEVFEGPGPQTS